MLVTDNYKLFFDHKKKIYKVKNKQAPLCPDCGNLMSGYCSRYRSVIFADGNSYVFLLRRLKCPSCKRLHVEIPDIIIPRKHYSANVIRRAIAGDIESCPADDSTIRKWQKSARNANT
ncbi:MAG: DUF6431 domain-containing protein [Vallitaleaceae bacterium]|nr:DUF6431 domain-containing protein [Vallitaleaceae bacterium]